MMKFNWKRMAVSIVSMIIGTVVVLFSILLINSYSEGPKEEKKKGSTSFEVKKQQKKKKQKRKMIRRRLKKKKVSKSLKSIAPATGGFAGGVDFGLPEFAMDTDAIISKDITDDVKDVVMTSETVDIKPVAGERIAAQYPERARRKGVTGYVVFNILISETGAVENIRILESSPSGVFEESAKAALKQWVFEPAIYQGKKVRVWAKQKISFKLQ